MQRKPSGSFRSREILIPDHRWNRDQVMGGDLTGARLDPVPRAFECAHEFGRQLVRARFAIDRASLRMR
jgi:hypothetical protein